MNGGGEEPQSNVSDKVEPLSIPYHIFCSQCLETHLRFSNIIKFVKHYINFV